MTPARYKDYEMEAVTSGRGRRAVSSDFWSQPEGSVLEPQKSNGVRRHGESQELLTRLLGQHQEPGNGEGLQVGAGAEALRKRQGTAVEEALEVGQEEEEQVEQGQEEGQVLGLGLGRDAARTGDEELEGRGLEEERLQKVVEGGRAEVFSATKGTGGELQGGPDSRGVSEEEQQAGHSGLQPAAVTRCGEEEGEGREEPGEVEEQEMGLEQEPDLPALEDDDGSDSDDEEDDSESDEEEVTETALEMPQDTYFEEEDGDVPLLPEAVEARGGVAEERRAGGVNQDGGQGGEELRQQPQGYREIWLQAGEQLTHEEAKLIMSLPQ